MTQSHRLHRLIGLTAFMAASSMASLAQAANPTVLSFDDIGSYGAVPGNYGGLDWSASSWLAFGDAQAPYTAHSGDWRATLDFGGTDAASAIRFVTPNVFDGAWFAGYSDATVTFQLYLGNQLVGTSATLAPSEVPTFLGSGYAGLVDKVVVASPQQAFYVMDDFTFQTTTVPEPGAAALLLAGLCALGALRRRRA